MVNDNYNLWYSCGTQNLIIKALGYDYLGFAKRARSSAG